MGTLKQMNIKNRTYYFYNDVIGLENFYNDVLIMLVDTLKKEARINT